MPRRTWSKNMEHDVRFKALVEAAPGGILVAAEDGTIVLVNERLEHLFGYTRDELVGSTVEMLIPERFHQRHIAYRSSYSANPNPRQMGRGRDLTGRRKDGTEFPVEIGLNTIATDKGLLTLAFVTDITERKRAQEESLQAELLRAELRKEKALIELRERFISLVSHDFRTPLAVIQTFSDLLRLYFDRISPKDRLKYLDDMQVQIKYMVTLLDDVLVLDRVKSGKIRTERAPLDLLTFCRDVLDQVRLTDDVGHLFVFTTEGNLAGVLTDEHLLRRILLNLLSNAIKYSPGAGEIHLHVSVGSDTLLFQVTDQGVGIPAEDQKHLFEAFYRARNVGKILGTGLGLAIVKSSVDALGGTISCKSNEGEGTTFLVRLPVNSQSL